MSFYGRVGGRKDEAYKDEQRLYQKIVQLRAAASRLDAVFPRIFLCSHSDSIFRFVKKKLFIQIIVEEGNVELLVDVDSA